MPDLDEELEECLEEENEEEESADYDSDDISLLDISVDSKRTKASKDKFAEKNKQESHATDTVSGGRKESAGEENKVELAKTPPEQIGTAYKGSLENLIPTAEQGLKRRVPKKN